MRIRRRLWLLVLFPLLWVVGRRQKPSALYRTRGTHLDRYLMNTTAPLLRMPRRRRR